MQKIMIVLLIIFSFYPTAFAASMTYPLSGELEITSDFGWREHPIFHTKKFHAGMDLGADYGQEVHAAGNGVVNYAGWISGYGNTVIISHGNGLESKYAHNQSLTVIEGQTVNQGEVIALAGSTGNSTGPHCHFEIDLNYEPVNPRDYCDGAPPASGSDSFFKTDTAFFPFTFDASVDFAKPLRDATGSFSDKCTKGLAFIQNQMRWLFIMLLTIDLAVSAMWTFYFKEDVPVFNWLLSRLMFYGFLVFVMMHWSDWIINVIKDFFVTMGSIATGSTIKETTDIISDPTKIMQKGASLVAPLFNFVGTFSGMTAMFNMATIGCTLFLAFAILICFALISYQIVLAYIEFYLIALFSFVSFSFSGIRQTRQYASDGLNALFAVSIRLMFYCVFSVIISVVLQNMTVSNYFNTGSLESAKDIDANGAEYIEQFMAAVRQVESSGGNYTLPSDDGYGYGAYQIGYANWDSWCREAGITIPAEWTPDNQDAVARHKMLEYYDKYGSWRDVAIAWNGGEGAVGQNWSSTNEYVAKIENAFGHPIQKTINIILLFSMLIFCILFMWFGNRLSKDCLILFGGSGFRLPHQNRDSEI